CERQHISHGDIEFPRSLEGITSMGGKHVVEHEDISLLPGETDLSGFVSGVDLVHDRVFDRGAIAVVAVARQIFFGKHVQKGSAYFWFQAGDMPVRGLIPPDKLSGDRMLRDCRAHLACAEMPFSLPLKPNRLSMTIRFRLF